MKAELKACSAPRTTSQQPFVARTRMWTKPGSATDWMSYLLLTAGAAVAGFMLYLVHLAYTPVLWVDQWAFLQDLVANHGHYSLRLLWKQHNEHRIPLPKLFSLVDLYFFAGRNLFLHTAVFAVQCAHVALLAVVFRRIGQLPAAAWRTSVAIAVLSLFWVEQAEIFVFPWNVAMILPYIGATIAFSSLGFACLSAQENGRHAIRYLLYGCGGVLIAALSLTNGLLLVPMFVFTMLVLGFRLRPVLAASAGGAVLILVWMIGSSRLVDHTVFPSFALLIRFVLLFFASSWSGVSLWLGTSLAAVAIPAAAAAYVWVLLKRRGDVFAVVLLSLAMFALASSVIIAFGRSGLGLEQARTQRYQTGPLLFWCSLLVLVIRQISRAVRARTLLVAVQIVVLFVFCATARLALQYAAGTSVHGDSIRAAALALDAGVNDSPAIMYTSIPPYRAEDILLMSGFLRARHWSIFSRDRERGVGREFTRFYRIVPAIACRGAMDPTRSIADYRWSGFRFSGWAYDVAAGGPASAGALVDSTGRLIGVAPSGFYRADAPEWAGRKHAGFIGYVPADLKAQEVRAFAILADGISACPIIGGAPLYLDLAATVYSGLQPTGITRNLTHGTTPAFMFIDNMASQPIVVDSSDGVVITGGIVDFNKRSGRAADVAIDGIPIRAEYGYERRDAARTLASPDAIRCGFRCTLPRLHAGEHHIGVRVVPKDQDIYYDAWTLTIVVRHT